MLLCYQSLVLYGLYRFVVEQLDSHLARGKSIGISIRRHNVEWLCECQVIGDLTLKSVVLAVVSVGTGWESRMLSNVVPVLLRHSANIRQHSTECDTRIGYALAAAIGVRDPQVIGRVTQMWLLDLVRKLFLAEFGGLDPLSVLEYWRVRLSSVVQEGLMNRLPQLRRVSGFYDV